MRTLATLLALVAVAAAFGQSARSLNNEGVDAYEDNNFADAEVNFRKGAEREPKLFEPSFNLGDAYYKQGKYEEAIRAYQEAAAKTQDKGRQAEAWYNVGNALLKSDKIKESVGAYSNALKLNPDDRDAKYNLSLALSKLKNQQNQQNQDKNQDENKDDKQDKNQDRQKQDDDKQDDDKQDQNKQNQDQENQGDQKRPQPRKNELTKEEAERILEALKNNEKNLQEELRKKRGSTRWIEKDW
jgi:Ca-activated chloride channel homolog